MSVSDVSHIDVFDERTTPTVLKQPVTMEPTGRPEDWSWQHFLTGIYMFGACALLVRLAVGTVRAHQLIRGAIRRDGKLISPLCAAPMTVGWLRPVAILPEHWHEWPRAQLDAVLTHEHEHVRRRDPLVQWLALFNRAVFWFHPFAWWLERRLAALAEETCDAAVLARGHNAGTIPNSSWTSHAP